MEFTNQTTWCRPLQLWVWSICWAGNLLCLFLIPQCLSNVESGTNTEISIMPACCRDLIPDTERARIWCDGVRTWKAGSSNVAGMHYKSRFPVSINHKLVLHASAPHITKSHISVCWFVNNISADLPWIANPSTFSQSWISYLSVMPSHNFMLNEYQPRHLKT